MFPIDFPITIWKAKVKLQVKVVSTQYLLTLCLKFIKLAILGDFWDFWVTWSRSNFQHCQLKILWTICLIITKCGAVVATLYREWIIHRIYATLLNFALGSILFSNISCFCNICKYHTLCSHAWTKSYCLY